MKKLIFLSSLFVTSIAFASFPFFVSAQSLPNMISYSVQNVTTTSATITFTAGYDQLGSYIQNRQPLTLKYRILSNSEGVNPQINGTETEIPLQYTLSSQAPIQTVVLANLKQNEKYAVWIGHQAVQQCVTSVGCPAIVYTDYDIPPFFFTTKVDPSTVAMITKNLSFETTSSQVAILKKYLAENNFMPPSTTTTFDMPTLVGVIKFQIANNLTTDGVVGTASRNIINQWLINQAQAQ